MANLPTKLLDFLNESFSLYVTAHTFHWNVSGPNFFQYHKLFQEIYEDVYESLDHTAEHVRALGEKAPVTVKLDTKMSVTKTADEMVTELKDQNSKLVDNLIQLVNVANEQNEHGLSNFLAARLEQHKKWQWFLQSTSESVEPKQSMLSEIWGFMSEGKGIKTAAKSVYHRDYERTKDAPYRQYSHEEYLRKKKKRTK